MSDPKTALSERLTLGDYTWEPNGRGGWWQMNRNARSIITDAEKLLVAEVLRLKKIEAEYDFHVGACDCVEADAAEMGDPRQEVKE